MPIDVGMPTPASLSLQARFDQVEAGLLACQAIVDDMFGPAPSQPGNSPVAGAEAAGDRCIEQVQNLRERLVQLRERVGNL